MAVIKEKIIRGIIIKPDNVGVEGIEGEIKISDTAKRLQVYLDGALRNVVTTNQTQTLTDKTIDADSNTISNIEVDNLKSGVLNVDLSATTPTDVEIPSALAVKTLVENSSGSVQADVDDLVTLSGVPVNSEDLGTFTGTIIPDNSTVKGSLQALESSLELNIQDTADTSQDLQDHITNTTGAHAASAISVVPVGTISSTNTQAAIQELNEDAQILTGTVMGHVSSSNNVHGVTGNVVGTTDTQTLTNKTLTSPIVNTAEINNPSRAGVKEDTKANLLVYATTATNGQIVFATDEKKMYQIVDGALVGIGGGGQSLDTVFQLFADEELSSWDTTASMGGVFEKETVAPFNGDASYKFTRSSSPSTAILVSPAQPVALRFRGQVNTLYFPYSYDGANDIVTAQLYDNTNNAFIDGVLPLQGTNGGISIAKMGVIIPLTCESVDVVFTFNGVDDGKVLQFDDVQLTSDSTVYADLGDRFQTERLAVTGNLSQTTDLSGLVSSRSESNSLLYTKSTQGLTFLQGCTASVTFSPARSTSSGIYAQIALNGTSISLSDASSVGVSATALVKVQTGDKITFTSGGALSGNISVLATASSPNIVVPTDTFSTDTAALRYAPSSEYTLATLENAPIGTFITFAYAGGTNTRAQTTTAPTQTIDSMRANGVQIFTRVSNAASTAASPSTIAIQIGKGLKGVQLGIYKNIGKQISGNLDQIQYLTSSRAGASYSYNESSGILLVDAGENPVTTTITANLNFSDASQQTNGYLTINAGKTPTLVGIPLQQTAYLKDVKPSGTAGGTFTAGAWQTRTLNTLEGDTGFVTLSGNQFTLAAGKYEIEASAPAYITDVSQLKLVNASLSTDLIIGSTIRLNITTSNVAVNYLVGTISLSSASTLSLQHRCSVTKASDGQGIPSGFGTPEIYAQVKITKIS